MPRARKTTHGATVTLGGLQDALLATVTQALEASGIPEAERPEAAAKMTADALPRIKKIVLKALKRGARQIIAERRKEDAGFSGRNYRRWRKAFDLLEMMWILSEETGSAFNSTYRPEVAKNKDYRAEALTFLHTRSLLVTREIMCLMQGGFPDGAMARWRTLHELATIGAFIEKADQQIAHRYLASRFFSSYDAAIKLEEHAERAKLPPFSVEEIAEMKRICEHFANLFGQEIYNEYGWASPALNGNRKPNFRLIEKAVGLDHWRPRFKWASQHIHGPHRPTHALLGMAEAVNQVFLVGQSNSGMGDPLEMTAISLAIATNNLLASQPTIDHVVVMQILTDWSKEIGPLADKVEKAEAPKRRKRGNPKS